jgi:dipeptidyl aminopeptidase/acylaminoacyl peptidase
MVNFHGSPGFGQAFTDAINDHWGDRPLEDLQKGWEAALAANALDRRRPGLRAGGLVRRLHGQS